MEGREQRATNCSYIHSGFVHRELGVREPKVLLHEPVGDRDRTDLVAEAHGVVSREQCEVAHACFSPCFVGAGLARIQRGGAADLGGGPLHA